MIQRRNSLPQHALSASVALLLLPIAHKALHIAADGHLPASGGYALAWTAFAAAYWLHKRRPGRLWLVVAWITLLTAVTDLPVVENTVSELTGASW